MSRPTLRILCAVLATGLLAGGVRAQTNVPTVSAADKLAELFGDEDIAKGKGFEIKRSQLDTAMMSLKGSAAARGQTLPPAETARAERQLLQQLIRLHMLLVRATPEDLAKGKEGGAKRLALVTEKAGSEENLVRQLKSVGIGLEDFKKRLAEEATAEVVLEREIKVNVTDEEVKKFYDENPARFEEPEMVRTSHILLSTFDPVMRQPLPDAQKEAKRRQIDELLKRVKAGEDFAKLAKEFSEDPGSKDRGGELNLLARGQTAPEFEAAAFALGENQISDVVTTQFGYHIIKVLGKIPAKKVEFAKVSERIKEGLTQQALQKQLPDYFKKLEKDAPVEILDARLKSTEADAAAAAPAESDSKK